MFLISSDTRDGDTIMINSDHVAIMSVMKQSPALNKYSIYVTLADSEGSTYEVFQGTKSECDQALENISFAIQHSSVYQISAETLTTPASPLQPYEVFQGHHVVLTPYSAPSSTCAYVDKDGYLKVDTCRKEGTTYA